jgi:hypothetical protein
MLAKLTLKVMTKALPGCLKMVKMLYFVQKKSTFIL